MKPPSLHPRGRRRTGAPTTAVPRRALTVTAAAQALSVHRNSVYRLIDAGMIRYVRLAGGEIRIPLVAIDEYLAGVKPNV